LKPDFSTAQPKKEEEVDAIALKKMFARGTRGTRGTKKRV
jgi:hypothetical protein